MIDSEANTKSLRDYVDMFRRRRFSLILPALVIIFIALLIAFGLPATYQSQATILIEEQEVPQDLVPTTINSYAAKQVQVISQRVLTVDNISEIISKFDLYPQSAPESSMLSSELATKFRESVEVDLVSADVIDPRSRRPSEATIAFILSFSHPVPATSQKVTEELVALFLKENLRERVDKVSSTEEFLKSEAEKLNEELLSLEAQLADFKLENANSLPELYEFNLTTLERTQREISDVQRRIQALEKRKIELGGKLAQLSPTAPVVLASGETVLSSADRLKALQSEYRGKAAIYRDNHPDVVRLEREISALQAELGLGADVGDLRRQLEVQQKHLSELQAKYKDSHQDVQGTKALIAQLESSIRSAGRASSRPVRAQPDNPAYILLDSQLNAVASEISSLNGLQSELQNRVLHYESLLKKAPDVEKDYQALLRDYSNATVKYEEIRAKQREAAVSKNLEQDQKGQRFTLLEPPNLPLEPVSPNRPAILFMGFVLAAAAGLGFAALREVMDSAINGVHELTTIMGEAPLVVIKYIDNEDDILHRQRAWKIGLIAAVVVGLFFAFYLQLFYMP